MSDRISDHEKKYGKLITPKELAAFLKLDVRTVRKYASWWGGIEVFPGAIRFFENIIKEKIDELLKKNENAQDDNIKETEKVRNLPDYQKMIKGKQKKRKARKEIKDRYDPYGLLKPRD